MKYIKLLFAVAAIAFMVIGCEKGPDHSIRVKNDLQVKADGVPFPTPLTEVKIGSLTFTQVESGTATEYKPIDAGKHNYTVSAFLDEFEHDGKLYKYDETVTGEITIPDTGSDKYTFYVSESGQFELQKD